jgi:Mn-containing catalase
MFIHRSEPLHQVRVETPDPVFAEKLLEQYGGATGELSAAMTYLTQSFHTEHAGIRDMLQDIATEELGHLEMVAMLIEQHTKRGSQDVQDRAYKSTLFSLRGPGPHLVDSKGTWWDSRYVNEGGDVVRDLRADIAAEAGALQTYENLLKYAPDDGTRNALRHLATREVSHTHMFMVALKSLNKLDEPLFGDLKPDDTVNLYFNLSSGPGGADERGPWNSEPTFKYVANPLQEFQQQGRTGQQSSQSAGQQPR